MLPKVTLAVLLLAASACSEATASKAGPVVAEGGGLTITAGELQARFAEQAPPARASLKSLERRKQFLDNLVRFELLARAAEREGLAQDPEVQFALKQAMIARAHQRFLASRTGADVPEADIQRYYAEHADEFSRAGRVHAEVVLVAAAEGSSERAARLAQAKKLLARVLAEEPRHPGALAAVARERSDDAATRPLGGDLGLRTREELAAYGKELAEAAFTLAVNQTSPAVVETSRGFYLLRVTERQEEQTRTLAEVRGRIAARLADERKEADYDAWVKKVVQEAKVSVNLPELEKVAPPPLPPAGG